jgi:hypothetical protein
MNRIGKALFTAALGATLVAIPFVADAELYRYDDENGQRHVVDDINLIPAQFRDAALTDAEARKNKDVNIIDGIDTTLPPGSTAGAAGATSTSSHGGSNLIDGHDQAWWQATVQNRQGRIDELQNQIDEANKKEYEFSRLPENSKGGEGRERGSSLGKKSILSDESGKEINDDSLTSSEWRQKQLDEAEAEMEEFKESARRKGVPPGWLR